MNQRAKNQKPIKWKYPAVDAGGEHPQDEKGNSSILDFPLWQTHLSIKWDQEDRQLLIASDAMEEVEGEIHNSKIREYRKWVAFRGNSNAWIKIGSNMTRVNRRKDQPISRLQAEQWLGLPYRYLEIVERCFDVFLSEIFHKKQFSQAVERVLRKDFSSTGISTSLYQGGILEKTNLSAKKGSKRIPESLRSIPKIKRAKLRPAPRIYFLVKKSQVVYVGKTTQVWPARIFNHIDEGKKEFDSVFYVNCSEYHLNHTEAAFIKKFKPMYNLTGHELMEDEANSSA